MNGNLAPSGYAGYNAFALPSGYAGYNAFA